MYKCRKCEKEFRALTEWKNHEFDCIDYEIAQILELEKVKQYFNGSLNDYNYKVTPDSFIDSDDEILHKSIHFELNLKLSNGKVIKVEDSSDPLRAGYLNLSEDIIKYIENEQKDKELSEEDIQWRDCYPLVN